MKKYRSISIPEKLPSLHKYKQSSRNDSSRLRVASIRVSYQNMQELQYLQRENHDLRSRLKEISQKLSQLIESSKYDSKQRATPDPRPELNQEILKKNLFYYENECKRLETRQKQLSDPKYESELKVEIEQLSKTLASHEDKIKKGEANQKIREKTLNTVLETGELELLHSQFTELNTELGLYTKKHEKLKKLNIQTLQSYKDICEKAKEFEKTFQKLQEQAPDVDDAQARFLKENCEKLKKKSGIVFAGMDSKMKVMINLARKMQEDLESSAKFEDQLQRKLDRLEEESMKLNATLNGLVMNNVEAQKKEYFQQDFDEDFMYVTEKVD